MQLRLLKKILNATKYDKRHVFLDVHSGEQLELNVAISANVGLAATVAIGADYLQIMNPDDTRWSVIQEYPV